jgi:phage terminase large subunit-like protein
MSADNWILTYYQQICDGSVTVGSWIRRWYEIVVHGMEAKKWTFDQKKANSAINFIERYCHHHEGPLAPGLIRLELWQKAFLSVVFGIMDPEGRRQFREIILIIGRKQGKTAIMSGIGCYHLFVDGGYGSRVYVCAPKLEQARLCYEGIYQTIRKEPMMERLTKRRRTDLYIESNNSSAQPLAFSAKKSDGLNISLGILDEAAAFAGEPGLRQAEVVKSSQGARPEPQLFYPTTANFIDGGLYDELMKRATAVINGTSKETRLAPFLYMIDDVEKWNDINELRKSLPNLGVSVSVDYILEEIAVAEGSLSKKSEFLTKYCNVKQNGSLAWLPAEAVRNAFGWKRDLTEFKNHYCLGGIDLSQTTDLTSACVLIEKDGIIWIHSHFWLPGERLNEATQRDGIPYQMMIERGFLSLSGDEFVDYKDVFNWFYRLVHELKIYPLQIGYDRYSAQYLVQDLEKANFHMESVFQGYNLTGIEDTFEGMLREGRIRDMDDNDLLKIHMMDSAQQIESNTSAHSRKKLVKISKNAHVDGVAAILDAMCMRANHWAEMGKRLMNGGG